MGLKGLRVAHEVLGPKRDPNAPHNRPHFFDPAPVDAELPARAGFESLAAVAAADERVVRPGTATRPRRAPHPVQRDVQDGCDGRMALEGDGSMQEAGAPSSLAGVRGKVSFRRRQARQGCTICFSTRRVRFLSLL